MHMASTTKKGWGGYLDHAVEVFHITRQAGVLRRDLVHEALKVSSIIHLVRGISAGECQSWSPFAAFTNGMGVKLERLDVGLESSSSNIARESGYEKAKGPNIFFNKANHSHENMFCA